jgi:hypothetical protein
MLVIAPYRYFRCPKGTASRYCILVFDSAGKPFMPLTDFYDHEKGRIAESSALNYLNILLPFFRWLDRFSNYKGVRIVWDMEPEVIRIAVKDYLTEEMYCKVRPLNSFELIKLTQKSPNTIDRFLVALKNFYRTMIRLKGCHASLAFERDVLASKRPCNHQRELACPKRVAVIPDPLRHHDVRARIAQCGRPPGCVLEEERLQCAGDEVGAR